MANVFKNYINPITTDSNFQCPAGATITVIGMTLTNTSGGTVTARVRLRNPGSYSEILYNSIIMPNSSIILAGGDQKLILEAGDQFLFTTSPSYVVDIMIFYMLTT